MPGADRLHVMHRELRQVGVCSAPADQAWPGRFAERQAEADAWHTTHQGLVQVIHRLDDVRLTEDQVDVLGLVDGDDCQVQMSRRYGAPVTCGAQAR